MMSEDMARGRLAEFGGYRQAWELFDRVVHDAIEYLQDREPERLVDRDGANAEIGPGSRMSRVFGVVRRAGFVVGVWLMGLAGAVQACVICVPYPEKTAVDFLIDSATVILAREHPDKPFSYAPVEVLKGHKVAQPSANSHKFLGHINP